jgi:cobalt-zinc-cadmium efflux system protein
MTHDHQHQHHHPHHHHHIPDGENLSTAFLIGIGLNSVFVILEAWYGFGIHSLALLSDAGHNLSDVLSLILGLAAEGFIRKKSFGRFTFGLKRTSILIAFVNTVLLLCAVGAISLEAVKSFYEPVSQQGLTISWVAGAGILVNGITAFLFYRKGSKDLNIRSAFQHMAADALMSLGVVIAGLLIWATSLYWIDPVMSLVIAAVIVIGTWGTFRDSIQLVLDAAPRELSMKKVRAYLNTLPGVQSIHDLHIWNISTRETALMVHLIVGDNKLPDNMLRRIEDELFHQFNIRHTTIQVESSHEDCPQEESC